MIQREAISHRNQFDFYVATKQFPISDRDCLNLNSADKMTRNVAIREENNSTKQQLGAK